MADTRKQGFYTVETNIEEMEEKIRKHRRKIAITIAVIVITVAAVAAAAVSAAADSAAEAAVPGSPEILFLHANSQKKGVCYGFDYCSRGGGSDSRMGLY